MGDQMSQTKRFQILYKGVLAEVHLTHVKAKARAFELAKEKGWDVDFIQIKDLLQSPT